MKKISRGLFVTFEGGDGAGKTTLMAQLRRCLEKEGRSVLETRAPGDTPLGKELRNLLLSWKGQPPHPLAELFLFLADRTQHVVEVIQPALSEYDVVLCDRFNDSSIVYQGIARDLGEERVEKLAHEASLGLEPDLTFYLDIDPATALQRADSRGQGKDRLEAEGVLFQQRIREGFCHRARRHPTRIRLLNAEESIDSLSQKAFGYLHDRLRSHSSTRSESR